MDEVRIDVSVWDLAGHIARSQTKIQVPQLWIVPDSIDPSGTRNVVSELMTYMAAVPDGPSPTNRNVIRFKRDGAYRIDTSLIPRTGLAAGKKNVLFELNGAIFDASHTTDGQARHWRPQLSKFLTFEGGTVLGANPHAGTGDAAFVPGLQWQHAWGIEGCEDILVEDCNGFDLFGDFWAVEPKLVSGKTVPSKRVTIRGGEWRRNGRQALSITGAQTVILEDATVSDVRMSLWDLEPEYAATTVWDIWIRRNHTGNVKHIWLANSGSCNAGVGEVHIEDNVADLGSNAGGPAEIRTPSGCGRRGPWYFERNRWFARSGPNAALLLQGVHDALVKRNIVRFDYDARPRVLVGLLNSTAVRAEDNEVHRGDPRNVVTILTADGSSSDYSEVRNPILP